MNTFLNQIEAFVFGRRKLLLDVFFTLTAVMAILASRTRVDESFRK